MGDGKDVSKLRERIKSSSKDNILYFGYVKGYNKIRLYNISDVFSLPTFHNEGFPNVICEALASGLPIITTSVAGIKDAITDNKNGFLLSHIPPDNDELADRLKDLYYDSDIRRKMSVNNCIHSQNFDVKKIISDFSKIYLSI